MILICKDNYGVPNDTAKQYIQPLAGRDNKNVWPEYEPTNYLLVKDEKYECNFPDDWLSYKDTAKMSIEEKEVRNKSHIIPDWFYQEQKNASKPASEDKGK